MIPKRNALRIAPIAWWVVLLATASCSKPSTANAPLETPSTHSAVDAAQIADAGGVTSIPADAAPAVNTTAVADIGGPWVLFHRPAYVGPTGNHDGPDWTFETPKLPAIAGDGTRVLIPRVRTETLGAAPNLELVVLRVVDEKETSSTPLLKEDEFSSAVDVAKPRGSDEAGVGRAFKDLGIDVGRRIEQANRDLSTQGWTPLSACVLEQTDGAPYPCATPAQNITCGLTKIVYRQGQMTIAGDRRSLVRRSSWIPAPVKDPNTGGQISVRSCFSAMWFDGSRGVLVGELIRACQGGGDWCSAPSSWHVVVIAR